jgi:carbon storage regulator
MGRRSELAGGRTVARQEGRVQLRGSGRRPKDRPPTVLLRQKGFAMLVLSRKVNEKIVINDCITICIVQVRGDKVRLGIEAPESVPVHRHEVFEAIKRERAWKNKEALNLLQANDLLSSEDRAAIHASAAERPPGPSQEGDGSATDRAAADESKLKR